MKKLLKISMLSLGVAASGGAFAQGACSVNYEAVNSWGSGAQIKTTITNNGGALNGWELCYSYSGNDAIQNLWDGTFTQTGKNVCVKNAGYNGSLPAAGTASFGFIVNNLGAAPTSYTLNGVACGGVAASSTPSSTPTPSSRSSSTTPLFSSSSSSSVAPSVATRWSVNGTKSTFNFVAVKKINTAENFTFTTLQGTVNSNGQANLTIPLSSIVTGIDIRNTRMQSMLFETDFMPSLHFSTQLSLTEIDGMAVGSISTKSFTGSLTLHGITKDISFDALVVKHDANNFSVSPRKAIVINSVDFDLASGIETLRTTAALDAIGQKVPVYFKLFLTKDNAANVAPIQLAAAPATPLNLLASLSQVTGVASLNWSDVSNNETGFVVRRKDAAGLWSTVKGTAANTSSYQDTLTTAGAYDYKVIAFNGSMPSPASNAVSVTLTGTVPSSVASSSVIVSSSSVAALNGATLFAQQCTSCHALTAAFPAQKNQATLAAYITSNMPIQNPALCGTDCGSAIATYLLAPRSSSSIVPSSVSSSSAAPVCVGDTCAPRYAERLLRVLSKSEYINSINDITGVNLETALDAATLASIPADLIVTGFTNNSHKVIGEENMRAYNDLASRVADTATLTNVVNCSGQTLAACGDKFVTDFGPKVFRRPFTAEERTAYLTFFSSSVGVTAVNDGIKLALRAALSSPQFLYRSELGVKFGDLRTGTAPADAGIVLTDIPATDRAALPDTAYVLTHYEMASFLAYTYTGSTPDATLLTAAANKTLSTKAQIDTQITRLLGTAKARQHYGRFATEWLNVGGLPYESRNATLYPTYTTAVKTAMLDEVRAIYNDVVLDDAAFTNLYSSNYTFANSALASFYGLSTSGLGTNLSKVTTTNRGGLLTSGAFLTQNAHFAKTAPILRAVRIRRAMLCHDVGNPPNGVNIDKLREDQQIAFDNIKAAQGGLATTRQEYHFLTAVAPCTTCHEKIINPLGFGFEDFSPVGLPRSRDDNNLPTTYEADDGTLYGVSSMEGTDTLTFTSGKNFGQQLVASPAGLAQLRRCFIENNYRTALGTGVNYFDRNILASDGKPVLLPAAQRQNNADDVAALAQDMAAQSDSPKAMLKQLGNLKSVRYRKDY